MPSRGDALRKVCVDVFVDGFPVDDSVDVVAMGVVLDGKGRKRSLTTRTPWKVRPFLLDWPRFAVLFKENDWQSAISSNRRPGRTLAQYNY